MLRILSYNIRFGGVGREDLIAEVIRHSEPDIVVLQEATRPDVVERLSTTLGMNTWAAKEGNSVAFISAKPVLDYKWHYHPRLQRAFMEIKLPKLTIYGVHLRATHSNYTERGRMREVKALLDAVGDRRREPHILTGDFNTLAPGELLNMQKLPWRYRILALLLGGRVTYHTIQIMLDEGYVDSYRLMNTDHGFTFPAWDPHVRLDYFFIPAALAGWVRNCTVIRQVKEAETASDHFPLLAQVEIAE